MDHDVLTEVPEALKRLVRYVIRGFYSIEHALMIDMLVHYPCIKEDDVLELLQFDRKQLRSVIHALKTDKLIKVKMQVETDPENRVTRHNFFYINYSTFVNVVKYKLDHMRRRIESEERNATNQSSFSCLNCSSKYTDLEADRLFDFTTGLFLCPYCKTELQSVSAEVLPGADSRTMMIKFNEQIEPVYALLREVEDIKLAPSILEPACLHLKLERKPGCGVHGTTRGMNTAEGIVWSGDATRNMDYFGNTEVSLCISQSIVDTAPEVKSQPIWMTQSTINNSELEGKSKEKKSSGDASNQNLENDEIMRTLLTHENKTGKSNIPAKPSRIRIAGESDEGTSSSEGESDFKQLNVKPIIPGNQEDEIESDGDDDDIEQTVMVGGIKHLYNDITEDIISKMTPEEKNEYIRIGQEIFKNMYD